MPKRASQKFGVECKMPSRPTFTLYKINPRGQFNKALFTNFGAWNRARNNKISAEFQTFN